MNKSYKSVNNQGSVSSVSDAISEVQSLAEEMRSWVDNMTGTSLESTGKYYEVEEAANSLENVQEPDIPECVQELEITYTEFVHKNKRKSPSRAIRLSNCLSVIQSAKEVVEEFCNKEDVSEDDKEASEQFISELEEIVSDLESIEFPSMYG